MEHRAVQVDPATGDLQIRAVDTVAPGPHQVRVDVAAAGICGADTGTVRSARSSAPPVTPGHEIAGTVAEVGSHVEGWQVGDRVAVGWFGGSCGHCPACRSGDVVHCPQRQVPGQSYPGGWATTVTIPAVALARIPDELPFDLAAPFGCAGVTTFNAIRLSGAPAGSRVAVLGIGGLGHLAVQFAVALGHQVIAIGRGQAKRAAALELGASEWIDSEQTDPGARLAALGGAALIVATAPSSDVLAGVVEGLAPRGRLTVVGFDAQPLTLPLGPLVAHARQVTGHLTGSPTDTEDAMRFAVATGVRPVVETAPLDDAPVALSRQQAGQAGFRIVLTP